MRGARVLLLTAAWLLSAAAPSVAADQPSWKEGVAVRKITPAEPMWMAGYSSRTKPAEGKLQDLYVKALALQDPAGEKFVLLTSDLVGLPRAVTEAVADRVRRRTGLPRERLLFTVSHTHCGPVLENNLKVAYDMPEDEARKIGPYTEKLTGWMTEVIVAALDGLKPAKLAHGKGTARFAVNRRKPTPQGIVNDANPDGPVDHDVPVLRVTAADGKLLAVVFGYACHNTTLDIMQWCGDYAGFTQADLEAKHPGAVAMFWMGCGGDANPLPRRTVELCKKYGKELADAVEDVLAGKLTPVTGKAAARYATVALPFDTLPGKEKFTADLRSKNYSVRARAEVMLKQMEDGKLDDRYRDYPVQVWRLGDDLFWVALGGEAVVDYSLRLKKELGGGRTLWVAAYVNDVMAYIPSERVLKEGGYEGDTSMIPYGMPTKWAPGIEDKIVGKAAELVKELANK